MSQNTLEEALLDLVNVVSDEDKNLEDISTFENIDFSKFDLSTKKKVPETDGFVASGKPVKTQNYYISGIDFDKEWDEFIKVRIKSNDFHTKL